MTVGFIVIAVVLAMVIRARKADQNYTIGSGLYKDSDYNLEKQRHADACDYNYYNDLANKFRASYAVNTISNLEVQLIVEEKNKFMKKQVKK